MEKQLIENVKKQLVFEAATEINEITEREENEIIDNVKRIKALSIYIACLCEETSEYNEYK